MLLELFNALTTALNAHAVIALMAAFLWGVVSILLSPCHLTSIPMVIGLVSGQRKKDKGRAFLISLVFSFGILITITFVGVITALSGRMLGDIGVWGTYLVAAVFILVGLVLLDVLHLPKFNMFRSSYEKKGVLAAFVVGLVFGLAVGPCTFAYMAPILAIVFTEGMKNILYGSLLVIFYAVGHCSIIVLAGTATQRIEDYLAWNKRSKGIVYLKWLCGLMIIMCGVYLFIKGA